jgi:hypothetical protein
VNYFEHFTSALDSTYWGSLTTGSGSISVSDGIVSCAKPATSDAAAIYYKTKVSKTTAQLYAFAFRLEAGASTYPSISLYDDASNPPAIATNAVYDPKVRMQIGFSTWSTVLGLNLRYYNTSHVTQYWNGSTNTWGSTGANAATTYAAGNFWVAVLETDPTLGFRMAAIANGITGTTWGFDQQGGNVRMTALTDWVSWASIQSSDDMYIVFGWPITGALSGTQGMEWFRHATLTRDYVMVSQKSAASGNYSCRVQRQYGDYFYMPYDRSTDAIASDARIPHILQDDDGTLACVYMTGGTGIKMSTASSMEGTWTLVGTVAANPGTTKRSTCADAAIYKDKREPDPNQRYKMFVSCLNAGPPYEARIYYLYSATLTGTYTWYNNGSGIDDSYVLGLGTSGQPDEGGVDCPRILPTAGGFTMIYSGLKNGSALLEAQPCYATAPNLVNGGTWTRGGSLPLWSHGTVTTEITATLNGNSATVTSTTGFVADAAFAIGQDGTTSDNHSAGRIRKVTDSTHLEFYAELRGFATTKPARIRQWDSSPRIDFLAIRWDSTRQKWVCLATVYQWFNLDSPTIVAHYETIALLTADSPTGTWTMDYTLSPPVPTNYFGGQRSNENPAFIGRPFGGAPPPTVGRYTPKFYPRRRA